MRERKIFQKLNTYPTVFADWPLFELYTLFFLKQILKLNLKLNFSEQEQKKENHKPANC